MLEVVFLRHSVKCKNMQTILLLKHVGHGTYTTDLIHEVVVHHHKCRCDLA